MAVGGLWVTDSVICSSPLHVVCSSLASTVCITAGWFFNVCLYFVVVMGSF